MSWGNRLAPAGRESGKNGEGPLSESTKRLAYAGGTARAILARRLPGQYVPAQPRR